MVDQFVAAIATGGSDRYIESVEGLCDSLAREQILSAFSGWRS